MQLMFSFPTVATVLMVLSFTTANPITEQEVAPLQKRAHWPGNINIGQNDGRIQADTGKGMWTAWANGDDPCHHHSDLGVFAGTDSPCNIRFSLDGFDDQWSMQGCGGPLTIWRNGQFNMGSCEFVGGSVGCVAGSGYTGAYQCHIVQ